MYQTHYTPATISDGSEVSNIWNLMVIVLPSNDAPIVTNAIGDIIVDEDSENIVISLMGLDSDPYFFDADGDTLNFGLSIVGDGATSATLENDSLHLAFTANMFGMDTIYITATDPSGDDVADTVIVTINPVNDAPEIVDGSESFETFEDEDIEVYIRSLYY